MEERPVLTKPRSMAAVILLFAYNGLVVGTYASSIPILKTKLGLDAIHLAIMFVLIGVGALITMQVSGWVSDRYGARRVCLVTIVPLIIAATGYAFSPSYPLLLVAGVFLGIGNGGIDVAMNALAVQVERQRLERGRGPIMSFFHAQWAIGSSIGSLGVSLVGTRLGLPPNRTVLVCCLAAAGLGVAVWVAALVLTPETAPVSHTTTAGTKAKIPPAAYLMGVMAIAYGLGEGTSFDWSGAHVQTVAQVDPRAAAWAVTVMTACMVVIRLAGDAIVARIGRRNLVRIGGAVSAAGYLIAAFAVSFPVLLLAWALVGLGIGVVSPQVYATAGHLAGGRGLAVVTSFGYVTFLAGPAFTGTLVYLIGIHHTMAVPGILLLGLIPLAGIAMKDPAAGAPTVS